MKTLRLGPSVRATYSSPCAECPGFLVPGQLIRANGEGEWMHSSHTPRWLTLLPLTVLGLAGVLCLLAVAVV